MEKILVLDFGGQYSHLIAKRLRLLGYYSEIAKPSISVEEIKETKGIILSGGPASVYDSNVPFFNSKILDMDIPILGLCYGHQLMSKLYNGDVKKAKVGEFGFTLLYNKGISPLFEDINFPSQVWMSHNDEVTKLPEGFEVIGSTKDCEFAAIQNFNKKRFGLQFHIEVKDTPIGGKIFENFAKICNMPKNWDHNKVLEIILEEIKRDAKDKNVLLFLSGGVDSTVSFALLNKALGNKRVLGLHIDNGFMRKNESKIIAERYNNFGFNNFIVEDASNIFLEAIKGVIDPQEKRKIIGETFLKVRDKVLNKLNLNYDEFLLAQGTLYPDIIESGGTDHSHTIKTHHNRVEGIKELIEKGLIIEPLKDLYKDEVRIIGKKIGLPDELVYRHPFPGPGLSINVICSNGKIDKNFYSIKEEIKKIDLREYFKEDYEIDILPVKSVGVQGDARTYKFPVVIKNSNMLKDLDWDKLELISSNIINKNRDINRVIISLFERRKCFLTEGYCTKERLDMLREVDSLVIEELKKNNLYNKIFQHLTIILPFASNSSHCSIVLRPVVSEDVMTARFARFNKEFLATLIEKIKKIEFVDALFYDITNKPPATFGWE
ncbi:MAG TPA: glutamine-hydrolyzing GMP synthase [Spirochaetota bacterium]|nr:glutamine-hydrolyzing GMP synthase [Spirochaetota bacterium]HOL56404.1 glutamine-hydrolyzing GMP synthase [Spirochaetota bacterium]HPP03888.1 glutamine-hydrolyzing GMP synthase [Spirochaetota bacterium]